ncbi:MAG: exopolysaccharide Pel transporter PelG [Treponema sp.]|nr:exopolysaccharide Pel transporter PelG [Treponema sp.]
MAGIGFELNKLFNRKSIVNYIGAYTAAAMVFTGPVLLGIVLLLFVRILSGMGGAVKHEQDIIVVIITYSLIGSMLLNNVFSTTVTRYIADMMYSKKEKRVMPALHGCISSQLAIAALIWGPFMIFSGAGPVYSFMGFILFCELVAVWTLISFISAVKDYIRIIIIFAAGVGSAILAGLVLVLLTPFDTIASMLVSVYIGYGVMVFGYYDTLKRYFPESEGGAFKFVEYFFLNPQLSGIGLGLSIGTFSHFLVVWLSPFGERIIGNFFSAPMYDVPALFAFITTLITTINFSTTTEVYFYPAYRNYYNLLNTNGSLQAIELAERDMLRILRRELLYLIFKQFVVTLLVCSIGSAFLGESSFAGFNATSRGLFRVLSVGYGIFASANGILMFLFYFTSYKFSLVSTSLFAAGTLGFSLFFLLTDANISLYGFSIMGGAVLMYISALFFLWYYTRKLQYHIYSKQPLLAEAKHGKLYYKLNWVWKDAE